MQASLLQESEVNSEHENHFFLKIYGRSAATIG